MGTARVGMVGIGCVAFATVRDASTEIGSSSVSNIEQDTESSGAANSRRFRERRGIAAPIT